MKRELIERAIESARARIYKLSDDEKHGVGEAHQKKIDNQKEVMMVTVGALKKQIPTKPMPIITDLNEYICTICSCCQQVAVDINDQYCKYCGQRLDWSE